MEFAREYFLYLLIFVVAMPFMFWHYMKKRSRLIKAFSIRKDMILRSAPHLPYLSFILLVLVVIFTIMALAGPRWGSKNLPQVNLVDISEQGEVIIAIDVSASMNAIDVIYRGSKMSRINAAINFAKGIIKALNDVRVGIVVFSGVVGEVCPLTTDYNTALMIMEGIEPKKLEIAGTSFEALISSIKSMYSNKLNRMLVLLSDGEDNTFNKEKLKDIIKANNIKIFSIGVGSKNGSQFYSYNPSTKRYELKKDKNGKPIISYMKEENMKYLADISSGIYFNIETLTPFQISEYINKNSNIKYNYDPHLKQFRKREEDISYSVKDDKYYLFLLFALIMLIWEFNLFSRKNIT